MRHKVVAKTIPARRRGRFFAWRQLLGGLAGPVLIGLTELLQPQGGWLPYLALPLFFIDGAVRPALILMGSNFLLELVPESERPLYLGLSNTLMGAVVLVSGLAGLLVDIFGFAGLFIASLGLCLTGYVLALGLPEPRETGSWSAMREGNTVGLPQCDGV